MPMVVAKRNARERTRVHTVNQAFAVLKQHLPSLRQFTKRVSKLRILNAAITYIQTLLKLTQSADVPSQSLISATLAPILPTAVRSKAVSSLKMSDLSLRELPTVATCAPDHSLVDYRPPQPPPPTLPPTLPAMPTTTVFAPQPTTTTFPYMKTLLDYPTYFYQPPATTSSASSSLAAAAAPSHIIVNNQIVSMPTYPCF